MEVNAIDFDKLNETINKGQRVNVSDILEQAERKEQEPAIQIEDEPVEVKKVTPKGINLPKVDIGDFKIEPMKDEDGKASESLKRLESKYNSGAIPLSVAKLPSFIIEVKDHEVIVVDGIELYIGNSYSNNIDNVTELAKELLSNFNLSGEVSLMTNRVMGSKEYKVPAFNLYEISYLLGIIQKYYKADVISNARGELSLLIDR